MLDNLMALPIMFISFYPNHSKYLLLITNFYEPPHTTCYNFLVSCCFCTWPRNSTWQNACHIRKGRYTRHLVCEVMEHIVWASAKFKSWCKTDPVFYVLYKNINYLCVRQTLSMNTEKASSWDFNTIVRTGIQWTTLFCVYFVMCGLIAQWPSKFNASIHRLIGDIFFVTKCIVKWSVIWWNLFLFEHLHFLIYPKCTFVRITAFRLLSMNNYTVL